MIIGCTGNFRKKEFYTILSKVHDILSLNNINYYISSDLQKNLNNEINKEYKLLDFEDLVNRCDLIFAIGGDGTILSTVRRMGQKNKPVMGIHIGGLGFLSECVDDNLEESINEVLDGNYTILERMLLEVRINVNNDSHQVFWAFNDIVINSGQSTRMLKVKVKVSNHYLNTFSGDGIIMATPTGSTAYSLSSGGPIIFPELDSITVTPICPHSLSARPIVIRPEEKIQLSFPDNYNNLNVSIDGQVNISINSNTQVNVCRARHTAQLVSLYNYEYFKTLRTKMGWSGNIR